MYNEGRSRVPAMSSGRALLSDRSQPQLSELDLGSFRLQRDAPTVCRCAPAVIYKVSVDPDLDRAAGGLDHHGVPLPDRLFGAIGKVADSSCLALSDSPFCPRSAPPLHIGNADVLHDA